MAKDTLSDSKTYRFACTLCGDCCRGRQEVSLNRDDLILMARHKGMRSTAELFHQGFVEARALDNGCYRPFMRFRVRPLRMCPFLINNISESGGLQGLCRLHPHDKPLVCHLAPLGRVVDTQTKAEEWDVYEPSPGCPGMNKGPARPLYMDIAPFRERLDNERDFFTSLEHMSAQCATAEEAVTRLFTFPII